MDNRCTVCNHASLSDIDQALMDGLPCVRPLAVSDQQLAKSSGDLKARIEALAPRVMALEMGE